MIKSLIGLNNNSIQEVKKDNLENEKGFVIYNESLEFLPKRDNLKYVFYGELNSLNSLKDINGYSFFFSNEKKISSLIDFLNEEAKKAETVSKSFVGPSDRENKILNEEESIEGLKKEVDIQKSQLAEIKSLRQYVIRLLEVKSVEELILETERLRLLRARGLKVSLIHASDSFCSLYTRNGSKRIQEEKMQSLYKNYQEGKGLREELANLFERPVLKFTEVFRNEEEEGEFYAIFETQEDPPKDDYFLFMLRKLLFTNFTRVVQSESLIRDTTLISQAFKQINAKAALITKDYKIRYSDDLEGVDKTCYNHLFNRVSPCPNCPLQEEESGFFEIKEIDHTVNSSFVSNQKQKFGFHIYETIEEGRRRESIKLQRGKLKSLGVVTQSLTHELNNPLGGILELSKELSSTKDGQLKEDFHEVAMASQRCLRIINNLQSFASKKIKFTRINLAETIEKAMTFTKVLGREVNRKLDLDKEVWISGSDTLLQQVVFNLFKNSVEAMKGKGDIFINLYRAEKKVILEVKDSGPGFPKEMSSIELFGSLKKKEGTGLGLFLVQEFIHLHQAELDFGNNPDQGSYFRIIFKEES